jgi:hypothetical protein
MPAIPRILPAALLLLGFAASMPAAAQPADGYIGPETTSEPQPAAGAKSGRFGGGGWSGDWRYCADEGDRCSVRGWGAVRYGARGRYVYREVRNAALWCDNRMFGDPAPGRSKRCEVRLYDDGGWGGGGDGYGWTFCARENEACRVNGPATVRFGVNGRFYEREVRGGSVFCSIQTFGDPAPREHKVCEVRDGGGWNDGNGGWGGGWSGGWTPCARENDVCRLPGPGTVRYGTERRFVDQEFRGGSVRCDNRTFGDPAPREDKFCSFRTGGGWGNGGGWGGSDGRWTECAREGGFCRFSGRRSVWYGAGDGRAVVREFRDGVPCTNEAFGGDPAPREHKRCAVGGY